MVKLSSLLLPIGGAAVVVAGVVLYLAVRSHPAEGTVMGTRSPGVAERAGGHSAPHPDDAEPMLARRTERHLDGAALAARSADVGLDPADQAAADAVPEQPQGVPVSMDVDGRLAHDRAMDEANKAYDRSDYDDAKAMALKILETDPANIRMRRIVVSSACLTGDEDTAQAHYVRLPKRDRDQMQHRCSKFGMTLKEP